MKATAKSIEADQSFHGIHWRASLMRASLPFALHETIKAWFGLSPNAPRHVANTATDLDAILAALCSVMARRIIYDPGLRTRAEEIGKAEKAFAAVREIIETESRLDEVKPS